MNVKLSPAQKRRSLNGDDSYGIMREIKITRLKKSEVEALKA